MDLDLLENAIEKCCKESGSKLMLFEKPAEVTDEQSHYVEFALSGGLNGHGKWKDYFESLHIFTDEMFRKDYDVWVIDLQSDCLDDVFTVYFGVNW